MVFVLTAAIGTAILFSGAIICFERSLKVGFTTGHGLRVALQTQSGFSREHGTTNGRGAQASTLEQDVSVVENRSMSVIHDPPHSAHSSQRTLDSHSFSVPPVDALVGLLHQLAVFLSGLSDDQYTTSPVGPMPSSIGGHVRHNLDHIRGLVIGVEHGRIDYDARERGTPVETSRHAALTEVRLLEAKLRGISAVMLPQPIELLFLVASDAPPITVTTTIGRELAFVQSHTIHHNAMIAAMAALLQVSVPPRFGYAPATLAFVDQAACAPSPSSR